jgi:hypothetical protein
MSNVPHRLISDIRDALWSAQENTQLLLEDHLLKYGDLSTTKNDSWLRGYYEDLAEFKRLDEQLLEYYNE